MLRKNIAEIKSDEINKIPSNFAHSTQYPVIKTSKVIEGSVKKMIPYISYHPPVFGLRKRVMYESDIKTSKINMGLELVRDYHLALFKATIKALNCDTVEISASAKNKYKNTTESEYCYVRDPVVILHDKGIMISTEGNYYYCSEDIIRKVKEKMSYKSIDIPNAYFEGGNMFYFPEKKLIVHGSQPGGHYGLKKRLSYPKDFTLEYTKVHPAITKASLNKILKSYDISVTDLATHRDVVSHDRGNTHNDYYFHLDCFMQPLPDGRVVILNKKILSEDSQKKLEQLFGDNLIDLAYPDYLTKPVLLNFIVIPYQNKFAIICSCLPDMIIESLSRLNLEVITPASLDARKPHYNHKLAERVVQELKKEGYDTMNANNLGTHLAWKKKGYDLEGGGKLPSSCRKNILGKDNLPIDEYLSKIEISFDYGGGGPHCFTTEIVPMKPRLQAIDNLKDKLPKPSNSNRYTFFNEPNQKCRSKGLDQDKLDLGKINEKYSNKTKNIA